jgi:UDP-2,3-diacylglucosamine pyrophosphatase LpxH
MIKKKHGTELTRQQRRGAPRRKRRNMMTASQKTIIISDVHISNGAGYSWFLPPYPDDLTAMLNSIANDSSVGELVLLGDVFDLWVYPLHVVPWTVNQIIQANPSVTKALQLCVQNIPNVYYMTGNHDMGVVESDLQPFSSGGKHIQWISPDWYNAKYQNKRHLEHGHAVDMFNAPDTSSDTIGGYPLGFFISRMVATASDQSAVCRELNTLLQALGNAHRAMGPAAIAVPSMGSLLVEAIITLLEKLVEVQDNTPIRFSEPDLDKKYTVADIKSHYRTLYSVWLSRYPDPEEFLGSMLVGVSSNGLDWYANKLLSGTGAPNILVMGHTHHAESVGRYVNDGCWCIPSALGRGDATPSYVMIDQEIATLIPWK